MKPPNRVQEHRIALQLSQRALSDRAGLGRYGKRTVCRVERREVYPQLLTRQKLAVALLTSVEELFPRGG